MFDYLTLIFIVVIALFAIIGLVRGGFKTVAGIIAIAAAVLIAVFVTRPLGDALAAGGLGTSTGNLAYDLVCSKVSGGSDNIEVATFDVAIYHDAYAAFSVPEVFFGKLDEVITAWVANVELDTFVYAVPLATIISNAIIYGGTFLVLFLVSALILGIIVSLIAKALLKSGNKVGPISHLVGFLFGAAIGAAIVWAACLSINLLLMFDSPISEHLNTVLHLTEGDTTWTFAKWCVTTDLGYTGIINFLIH
jgi:uncharacterized membrane protein required for colicin V production